MVCEKVFHEEGIFADVTLAEYPLDFIPFDSDILSLELDIAYKASFSTPTPPPPHPTLPHPTPPHPTPSHPTCDDAQQHRALPLSVSLAGPLVS